MPEDTNIPGNEPPSASESVLPPPLKAVTPRPFTYWLGRVTVCNPFYLFSVVLLLYAIYCISVDPGYFEAETAQLTFNFASLQIYELMLVATAVVLVRRLIWNDATLLVILESLLVLLPFMLVSQAALIEQKIVLTLTLFAAALAGLRWVSIRRWMPALPLTRRLSVMGFVVLVVNAALPVLYRSFHEFNIETKQDWGAAYDTNRYSWLLLLPGICALAILLPRLRVGEGKPLVERQWLPLAIFALWAMGTGVHLWALGYVYDFDLRREMVTPTLWVLGWVLFLRLKDFMTSSLPELWNFALTVPLVTSFLAAGVSDSCVFPVLIGLNLVAYTVIWMKDRANRPVLYLVLATLSVVISTVMSRGWVIPRLAGFEPATYVFIAILLCLLLCAVISGNPMVGIGGAIAASIICGLLPIPRHFLENWPVQTGLVFLLLHSLRWVDREHTGAAGLRYMVALVWIGHSFGWVRDGVAFWQPLVVALTVLTICLVAKVVCGVRLRMVVPVAAALVALCAPANYAFLKAQAAPLGLIALGASFLLFALGTLTALKRHHWLREDDVESDLQPPGA